MADASPALLKSLSAPVWSVRLEAVQAAAKTVDAPDAVALVAALVDRADDPKWEIRKAVAEILAQASPVFDAPVMECLERLVQDKNGWVREAATRSRVLRTRSRPSGGPLTSVPEDPLLKKVFELTQGAGKRRLDMYELAISAGEHYYADLAAETAHQLNTLLTPIDSYVVALRAVLGPETPVKVTDMLEALQDSTQKLEATVRQLRVYTGRSRDTYRTISLGSMLQEAIQSFETKYGSVRVTLTVPDTLEVDGYPDRLRHVVVNVMDNAGQAMPEGGTLRVTGGRGADEVYLRFEDDGVGMTEAQTTDAFRRFATTRRDEGGTGLGLPIAKRIVEHEHHGRLELRSQLGRGTEVTIRLPITRLGAP